MRMLDKRLVIVSGKGGVGKSAVTAATALAGARHGKKVLAIATNDPVGLATHLGRSNLGSEPEEISPGLHATSVDLADALTEYLRLQLKVPAPGFGAVSRAFDVLASTAPGIKEIITIGKVIYEVGRDVWDLVVVDAPPTGQIGSYLRAPRTVSELVPSGRVREQSDWMEGVLADDRTHLAFVTLAEELPVTETLEAMSDVEDARLGSSSVIANRLLPQLRASAEMLATVPAGAHRDAAVHHQAVYAQQRRWLGEITVDRRLPYLFGVLTPAEVAARLADEIRP